MAAMATEPKVNMDFPALVRGSHHDWAESSAADLAADVFKGEPTTAVEAEGALSVVTSKAIEPTAAELLRRRVRDSAIRIASANRLNENMGALINHFAEEALPLLGCCVFEIWLYEPSTASFALVNLDEPAATGDGGGREVFQTPSGPAATPAVYGATRVHVDSEESPTASLAAQVR